MNTLAVCDMEPVAIEGLRGLLESANGLRVIAAETSLMGAMDAVRELRPSILMLDRAFGMHEVLDCLRVLQQAELPTASVVWGNSFSRVETVRILQAGAAGVVRKTVALNTLLDCLHRVAAGETWMEDDMLPDSGRPVRSGHSPLTARELQVMELVERGLKNKEIAIALGIRTGTVKIHLKHIFEKTGIRGRYGLALSGLREKGLLAAC